MIKKILIISGIILLIGSAVLYFNSEPRTAPQTNDKPKVVQSTTPEPKPTVEELHRLTNVERESRGIKPLEVNSLLNKSASLKLKELRKNGWRDNAHVEPGTGKHGYSYIGEVGVSCKDSGENLSYTDLVMTPEIALESFMDSKAHRNALLATRMDEVGYAMDEHFVVMHLCDIM